MSERRVWAIQVVVEGTEEEAEQAEAAIAQALCPAADHPGPCQTPWTTVRCLLADLDDNERALWQASFDEDRGRPGGAGETLQ